MKQHVATKQFGRLGLSVRTVWTLSLDSPDWQSRRFGLMNVTVRAGYHNRSGWVLGSF